MIQVMYSGRFSLVQTFTSITSRRNNRCFNFHAFSVLIPHEVRNLNFRCSCFRCCQPIRETFPLYSIERGGRFSCPFPYLPLYILRYTTVYICMWLRTMAEFSHPKYIISAMIYGIVDMTGHSNTGTVWS